MALYLSKIRLNGNTYNFKDASARIDIDNLPEWSRQATKPAYTASEVGALPDTTVIPDISGKVDKSGDTMTGNLSFAPGKGIELNYNGYTDKLYLMGQGENYRTASFEYLTNLRNINFPDTETSAANKKYVDVQTALIKTTAGSNNTEYNLIGTATSNTNSSAVSVYNPTLISFAKTNDYGRLTLGSTSTPGRIRLYSSTNGASGFIDLVSGTSSTNERTITFPDASGTVALTSDIPSVPSWALQSQKPTYTAAEVGATTSSDVSSMISSAVSGITSFSTEIVSTLPSTGVVGRIYFVSNNAGTNDIYEEYIYVNNGWEKLGNFDASAIDLSDYLKTTDLAAWAKASTKPSYTASEVGALPSNTTYVSSFNGQSGAITYIPPVTSVNGSTGAVTVPVYDDTALAARVTVLENIPWVTYYTGSSEPSSSQGQNGDIYLQTES